MGCDDATTETRTCSHCRLTKPASEFNRSRNHGKNPYTRYCKSCSSIRYKEWAEKNRERKLAYMVEWYRENLAHVAAYDALRWSDPATKKRRKAVVAANPDRYNAYAQNYRALKASAPGRYTAEDIARIKKGQRSRCAACRKSLAKGYHVDHIKALSKGGTNHPSNLQLLCAFCNLSKADMDAIDFMQRRGLLL